MVAYMHERRIFFAKKLCRAHENISLFRSVLAMHKLLSEIFHRQFYKYG